MVPIDAPVLLRTQPRKADHNLLGVLLKLCRACLALREAHRLAVADIYVRTPEPLPGGDDVLRAPYRQRHDRRAGTGCEVRRAELALGERAGAAARPRDSDRQGVPVLQHGERLPQRAAVRRAPIDEARPGN